MKKVVGIILSVIVLALIVGVVVWYIKRQPATASTQEQQVIGTQDWKTYSDEEFGFEVKYPTRFVFLKEKRNQLPATETSITFTKGNTQDIDPEILGIVTIYPGNRTLEEGVKFVTGLTIADFKSINFAGQSAYVGGWILFEKHIYAIITEKDGDIFVVSTEILDSHKLESTDEQEAFFASFKFTN